MEIQFPPGVVKTDSLAASVGRYVEADHIRWVGGHAEKIGGWVKLFPEKLEGIPRSMHVYRAPSGLEVIAYGTNIHLYYSDAGDPPNPPNLPPLHKGPINITPFRTADPIDLPDNPFSTINGFQVVTVRHPGHGAVTDDTVYFTGATAVGGITINGKYKIDNIMRAVVPPTDPPTFTVDINYYKITDTQTASSTVPFSPVPPNLGTGGGGGGAAVKANYEVSTGTESALEGKGYGIGPYGMDTYGSERDIGTVDNTPRYWSLDNYGNLLLAAYQGGTIYFWDQDADSRARAIITDGDTPHPLPPGPRTPVPIDVVYAFVTEERFIFALRDNMNVSWPDQDNPTNWTPGLTSKANTRRLAKGNRLIAGASLGGGVSLVWTDTSVYQFQFTGGQFVYSSRMAGTNCGLLGPGAFCIAEGTAFWAGTNGFHIFNGSVQGIPNADDIHAWFYGNMTLGHRRKTTCWYNAADREVWFSAPLGNLENVKDRHPNNLPEESEYEDEPPAEGAVEPTHYVFVNIDSWHWGAGSLPRTCAAFSVTKGLLLGTNSGSNGVIYQHEVGNDNDGRALVTKLKSGLYRIPEAEKNLDIFGFSPDFEWQRGNITGRVFALDRPMNMDHADNTQTFTLTPTTGMQDIRVRGRYIGFELIQNVIKGDWRMGIPVAEMQEAGSRR